MIITVTDFERITNVSRHTVYSWFYRDAFPEGIEAAPSMGSTKLITVNRKSKHYEKIAKKMATA